MYLIGYHGTSAAAAADIIKHGPKKSSAYAALGSGFYVARDDDFLVGIFSRSAESRALYDPANYGKKFNIGGNALSGPTILKIYSRVPLHALKECVWDVMEYSQCPIGRGTHLNDLEGMANNLQMVIPNKYFHLIYARIHDKSVDRNIRPVPWPINEWHHPQRKKRVTSVQRMHSFR